MLQVVVTRRELEKALADLTRLADRGFSHSLAVMTLAKTGPNLNDDTLRYAERLIMRAHPSDPARNWGAMSSEMIDWYRFDGKKVVEE